MCMVRIFGYDDFHNLKYNRLIKECNLNTITKNGLTTDRKVNLDCVIPTPLDFIIIHQV